MSAGSMGGDFRVGEVLSRAWSVFTGNIIFFIAVPLLIIVVYFILTFGLSKLYPALGIVPITPVMIPGAPPIARGTVWIILLVSIANTVIYLCLHMFGLGVVLTGAFQRLRGEPLRVGAALQRASARLLPLVALSILVSLAAFGLFLSGAMVIGMLGPLLGGFTIVLFLGLLVLLFMLAVIWSVVVPACLVEGRGPIASMARSADLTRGYRWKVTGIVLLFSLILFAALIILVVLFAVMRFNPVIVFISEVAMLIVWIAYFNCVTIMIYHDLRVAKEGIDTSQIASVFD